MVVRALGGTCGGLAISPDAVGEQRNPSRGGRGGEDLGQEVPVTVVVSFGWAAAVGERGLAAAGGDVRPVRAASVGIERVGCGVRGGRAGARILVTMVAASGASSPGISANVQSSTSWAIWVALLIEQL